MIKKTFLISLILFAFVFGFMPNTADAIPTGLETTAGKAGLKVDKEPSEIIGNILYVFYGVLGIILLIILMYAGFQWMTAGGDENQVKKAKDMIINALIGIAIILTAYAATSYIIRRIQSSVTGTTGLVPTQIEKII